MLDMALEYREPIDTITGDKEHKLRAYELDQREWKILQDLHFVLKVGFVLFLLTV
jgi:hypothetical protein